MKTIPKLSADSEKRISAALVKVSELLEDMSPDEAIVKVASDMKLPAGHVRLMVYAFNNGRSLSHIRDSGSLEEKAAAFPLACASTVLERLFPSDIKTPAQEKHASEVSIDYTLPPGYWLQRRKQSEVPLVKAASNKNPPQSEYEYREANAALTVVQKSRQKQELVKSAAIRATYDVVNALEAVRDYFRGPTALPLCDVTANAVALHGPRASRLMDKVASVKLPQKASAGIHAVEWDKAPYSLIKQALDAVDQYAQVQDWQKLINEDTAEKTAQALRPFAESAGRRVITGSVWDNQSPTKEAGIVDGAIGGMASKLMDGLGTGDATEALIQKQMQSIGSPKHEDNLRAIRTRTMMHELMAADPVISGYPHQDVIEAFNHLSEIAPRAMQQRVMAQALLRKYLEQSSAMEAFDVDQMLGIENKLIDRDMPEGLSDNFYTGASRELGTPSAKPGKISYDPPKPPSSPLDIVKPFWSKPKEKV